MEEKQISTIGMTFENHLREQEMKGGTLIEDTFLSEAEIEKQKFEVNHNKHKYKGTIYELHGVKSGTFTTRDGQEYVVKNGTIRRLSKNKSKKRKKR